MLGVAFAEAADWSQAAFAGLASDRWWLPLLITPAGFVICAFLARQFFPGSQGSGIPNAIAARHLRQSSDRRRLLSPRLILGKIALTVAGLFCGASVGREGPTVQVGAAVMLQVARARRHAP